MLIADGLEASYYLDPASGRPLYDRLLRGGGGPYSDEHYALWLKCQAFHERLRAVDNAWSRGALRFFHFAADPTSPYRIFAGWYRCVLETVTGKATLVGSGEAFRLDPERHTPEWVTRYLTARRAAHRGDPSCRLLENVDFDPVEELPVEA